MRGSRRHRGFTLIEVLVAFAIFAMSIGALYELFRDASARSTMTRQQDRSLLVAQSIIAEQRARPMPWERLRAGRTDEGDVWEVTVEPFEADTDARSRWKAYEVSVRVSSQEQSRRAIVLRSIELAASGP